MRAEAFEVTAQWPGSSELPKLARQLACGAIVHHAGQPDIAIVAGVLPPAATTPHPRLLLVIYTAAELDILELAELTHHAARQALSDAGSDLSLADLLNYAIDITPFALQRSGSDLFYSPIDLEQRPPDSLVPVLVDRGRGGREALVSRDLGEVFRRCQHLVHGGNPELLPLEAPGERVEVSGDVLPYYT